MESDDDYESFSLSNDEPSPLPTYRRLKRLKKSAAVPKQSHRVKSVSELIDLPRVDFARLEALESSDFRVCDEPSEPFSHQSLSLSEGFDVDVKGNESSLGIKDVLVNGDRKETKRSLEFDEGLDDDDGKESESSLGDDDTRVVSKRKEAKRLLEFDDGFDDGGEKESSLGFDDTRLNSDQKETKRSLEIDDVIEGDGKEQRSDSCLHDALLRSDRKEAKRALEYDDEINGSSVDQRGGIEGKSTDTKIIEDGDNEDAMNDKKRKKKRLKSTTEDPKAKTSSSSKRKEEKERRAHLQQLHAESQKLLRETRCAAFKPVQPVQKPISSVLEKIRRRKLELSMKFSQSSNNDSADENDGPLREVVIDHSKSVATEETGDLAESVKEDKVYSVLGVEPASNNNYMDNVCGEHKRLDDDPSPMALDGEPAPAFRSPVDDTQDLFGDSQTSDSKDSKDEFPHEHTNSSPEEEMAPSWLTMKLKFDSAPDDISESSDDDGEEENDKENIAPPVHKDVRKCSSPKGDPVKAFVDDEAEEEVDSDNDQMIFGDEEDEDHGDYEELNNMIATGYKERPIDNEARNELHQKWLEEKDAAGTDDLLRRLNVASKLREASLLDEEEVEEDNEVTDDIEEDSERPRVARIDSRKAKQMIAQMFMDKDEDLLSSDDEETEKQLVRQCLLEKAEDRGKIVSPIEDEGSREVFGLIKKLNIVPETKKKAKPTSFFDTMLTGGNSNSSSKSSFLSRSSNPSVPTSGKKGSNTVRSFIFGRDDSNSRSSISISEDSLETIAKEENKTRKGTAKFISSQGRSSTQNTKIVAESTDGTTSLFDILKRSSIQSEADNQRTVVDLSQSVFAAFKIPKKPIKIQGRVQ